MRFLAWRPKMFPLALGLVYLLQCAAFVKTQSLTFDEPVHIAEGLNAWRDHAFAMWNDHPPLARLWCTLPLLDRRWQMQVKPLENGGWQVTKVAPDPESIAHRARCMNVILGLILAWSLWATARHLFSEGAANFALALFVFSPPLIAHFSLATTDGAATLLIFSTSAYLIRWREKPELLPTVVMGVLLGLLLLAKFSTPVMFFLATLWMLILKPGALAVTPTRWNWRKTAAAAGIAMLVVWAGYFFHISRLTVHDHTLVATFPNRPPIVYNNVRSNLNVSVPVPAGEFLEGLRNVVRRNRLGQPAYFWGKVSQSGGFRLYYPGAILLKWPVITLLLAVAGVILAIFRPKTDLWVMASFPLVYFVFAIFARFNIGDRHVLPVYPFMLLFAAGVWQFSQNNRLLTRLLLFVVILQFADTLRYAPGYLSYFNPYVRSDETYKLLSDSNVDWGQGLLALRKYEESHPGEQISLAYFGSIDPIYYGIRARPLAENQRVTGTVVVSATHLTGQYLKQPDAYRWLLDYPVVRILDHSLYMFRVPAKQLNDIVTFQLSGPDLPRD